MQDAERVKQSQEITQIIGDIDRRNEVFMNQNRDQGPYVLALYDVTLTFSDQAKVLLRNGEVHGASVYSDYSNKFLLFGERCVSGFKEIGVVARSGVKVVQRALLDSRDQAAQNVEHMMKDPVGYTSSIVRGIGEASNALSLGFARLMFDTKNFTQDAKKVLGALSERWNSLSSEEKRYHSVKTLCDFTLAGVTPVGIVGGGQALPSVENIKTLCAAIKNSDQVTTTLVSCSRPIADAFQKAGATATTVGQAVVDAVGVSLALVKEEKAVVNETLAVIKNNPQIVAQEGGIVNAVKKAVGELVSWSMPEGGKMINGRWYTQHALERMAPDTRQVREILELRAIASGFSRGSREFLDYVQPRGIPPMVIEDAIQHGRRLVPRGLGTLEFETDSVKVIINEVTGVVITVWPR